MKPVAPNAALSMSRTSSSGCETAFSMRMKRAGRCAAVVGAGSATVAMFGVRGVDAVEVVHALDVEDADAFGSRGRIEVRGPATCVEDHRRRRCAAARRPRP